MQQSKHRKRKSLKHDSSAESHDRQLWFGENKAVEDYYEPRNTNMKPDARRLGLKSKF